MFRIEFQRLVCDKKQESSEDEIELLVCVDGGPPERLLHYFASAGDAWDLSSVVRDFGSAVSVELWELDSGRNSIWDADDAFSNNPIIGPVKQFIGPVDMQGGRIQFYETRSLRPAHYVLEYKTIDLEKQKKLGAAYDGIADWRASTKSGPWVHLDKVRVIDNVESRIMKPELIWQGETPLCGPASVAYLLARHDPQEYCRVCRQLFENREVLTQEDNPNILSTDKRVIRAPDALLTEPPRAKMELADWMLLKSLAWDVYQPAVPLEGSQALTAVRIGSAFADDAVAREMGFPSEVVEWVHSILGFPYTEFEQTFTYGEHSAFQRAQTVYSGGGCAILLVDSNLLDPRDKVLPYPDHWVALAGPVEVDLSYFFGLFYEYLYKKVPLYTWQSVQDFAFNENKFESLLWGVVMGSRRPL